MEYITKNLEPAAALRFFEEICAIPHPSGGEERVADYLADFAKIRRLEYHRDAIHNVIIKKDGRKNAAPVILQGHTDMVSAVADGAPNLEKYADPVSYIEGEGISLQIDGDWLNAAHTTLGADNGVAVAIMLALLDTDTVDYPPLECVFTTQEETGLFGAAALDGSLLSGRRMINLDNGEEGTLTVSCAGGMRLRLEREFSTATISGTDLSFAIEGVRGGHSGVEIGVGGANAIKVCGELIKVAGQAGGSLASIAGGEADNAIPRSASASLRFTNEAARAAAAAEIEKVFGQIAKKYGETDPDMTISFDFSDVACGALSSADTAAVSGFICALPNGVQLKNEEAGGFVVASLNLGVAKSEGGKLSFTVSLRSSVEEPMEKMRAEVFSLAAEHGFSAEAGSAYPGWEYREVSPLRDVLCACHRELFGREIKVESVHAGLECGLFSAKLDGLDAVAMGVTMEGCHTPSERMSLSSFERVWRYICAALEKL